MAGEIYGKYHLLARIATGGMAEVFLARSSSIGGFEKLLAIKRMHPRLGRNSGFVNLFIEEAKLCVSLNHPNIVQVFDFGRVDEDYYIAMEYVEGVDLSTLAQRARDRETPLPVEASAHMLARSFDGMAYAHMKRDRKGEPAGIVHRDISPHNVLTSFEGQVKISDFGIAKARAELEAAETGEVVGKVAYMSPEQARGEPITTASDIWSGGVILHELLTNQRLFAKKTDPDTLSAVAEQTVVPPSSVNPEVPEALDALVLRLLERDPKERPTSAEDVAHELDDAVRGHGQRMNDFRLAETIRGLYDGEPPSLLAALERSRTMEPKQLSIAPPGSLGPTGTKAGTASFGAAQTKERTRPSRPKPRRDSLTPVPSAKWSADPFSRPPSRRVSTTAPRADEPPDVQALKAQFLEHPNLWLLCDMGDAYLAAGKVERALSAYELAAAKFAQQGLLVQAATIYRRLLDEQGDAKRTRSGMRALVNFAGMSDHTLMLELVDPERGTELSEFHALFDQDAAAPGDIFAPAPIFSSLDADQFERLVDHISLVKVGPSETVVKEGDPGDAFFWVGRGRVVISATSFEGKRVYLTSLADGDCFGEQSFFTNRPRGATVETIDEVWLLEIGRAALDDLMDSFPAVRVTLGQFYKDRIAETLLARSALFGALSVRDRRMLAAHFTFVNFEKGELIIEEGEGSDAFFALKSGQVEVFTGATQLAELGPGEIFGEIAALKNIPRTASVRTLERCEVLRLEGSQLREFLAEKQEIKEKMERQIVDRAVATARTLSSAISDDE